MTIPDAHFLRDKLEESGKQVHFLRVTQDGQVMICCCTHDRIEDTLDPIPILMVHLCVGGGGICKFKSDVQTINDDLRPGSIGIIPPNSQIVGSWPKMTVISVGISAATVTQSFGKSWQDKFKPGVLSRTFRDPLVETTMIDMGSKRAGCTSDAGLSYAAQMIAHQLLDQADTDGIFDHRITPLGKAKLAQIDQMLSNNLSRKVKVEEMADFIGMSRNHFTRRFKAATGQTPFQYAAKQKLEHAALMLKAEEHHRVIDVAQMIGFTNPAHFARAFQRQYGLTPRVWRAG